MENYSGQIISKLPQMGTSIFAVMSAMANEYNAINLAQGFPDFEVSGQLIEKVNFYMEKGYNQYAPMPGVKALRDNISRKLKDTYGAIYDADTEITITAGATQALFTVISAMIRDDDEVIIFEPAYDSYAPAVKANGGRVKFARLVAPDYHIDWEQLPMLISSHTRMIIINSPHNPTGSILSAEDMEKLERLVCSSDLIVMSDEVYEHLIYDKLTHESVCRYPQLAARSFVIGSFGKTFHATGWKVGYVLAPENLTTEFRKLHQFVVFAVNTPAQYAISDFLEDKKNYRKLSRFYQKKRDYFVKLLQGSRFKIIPSYGTYFQCVDYSEISDEAEMEFATRITKEYGVAAIPLSPFYNTPTNLNSLRLCFAKKEDTLEKAAEILCKI